MNRSFSRVLLGIGSLAAVLVLLAVFAGLFDDKVSPGLLQLEPVDGSGAIRAEQRSVEQIEVIPASVVARQSTLVSPRITARIARITVRAGDAVRKGDLLVELEDSDLRARHARAQASEQSIRATHTEAQQQLDRAESLYQQKLIASSSLDQARARRDATAAELSAAGEAVREAATALGFSRIRSPIDGRVVDRFAEPGDTGTPGAAILSLYNPESVEVQAQVREQLAVNLEIGQAIRVEYPALQRSGEGRIAELIPAANTGSRSFEIKAEVAFDEQLLPGLYARLLLPAGTQERLLIPGDKIARIGQLDLVWVVSGETLQRRIIRTGKTLDDGSVEILSGLRAGEQVADRPLLVTD